MTMNYIFTILIFILNEWFSTRERDTKKVHLYNAYHKQKDEVKLELIEICLSGANKHNDSERF